MQLYRTPDSRPKCGPVIGVGTWIVLPAVLWSLIFFFPGWMAAAFALLWLAGDVINLARSA